MKRSKKSTRRAFTLVEMLIVLAILVGLAALVVPRLLGTQKKADVNNTKAQIDMLKSCLRHYHLDMKRFPATEEGLDALITSSAAAVDEMGMETTTATTRWDGPYIEDGELPADPWGNPFQYAFPPTHGRGDFPDIWSFGPDGEDGTEDDITNWTGAAGEGGLEDEFGESDTFIDDEVPAFEEEPPM